MPDLFSMVVGFFKWFQPVAERGLSARHQQKLEAQHDFMRQAIGSTYCLSPDNDEWDETISFETVERRVRLLQQEYPEDAHESGMPHPDDPEYCQKLRRILNEMARTDKIKRGKANYWRLK
jgi:hypothetical protein